MALEDRMDELEARARIAELVADYAHGCDKRDAPRFMAIWHDDAVYDLGEAYGTSRGAEEIRRALDRIWEDTAASHHWMTNLVVEFPAPDRAEGLADAACVIVRPGGRRNLVAATYAGGFERRGGEWRISRCQVTVHWSQRLELGKPAVS